MTLNLTQNIINQSKLGRTRKARLNRLVDAYNFFRANAGGVVGREAAGALRLARAERHAISHGYYWELHNDECIGCMCGNDECPCFAGTEHECLYCVLKSRSGRVVASLGSICTGNNDSYLRVVKAELALEIA